MKYPFLYMIKYCSILFISLLFLENAALGITPYNLINEEKTDVLYHLLQGDLNNYSLLRLSRIPDEPPPPPPSPSPSPCPRPPC